MSAGDPFTLARHYLDVDQAARAIATLDAADEALLESLEYWELRSASELAAGQPERSREAIERGLSISAEDPTLLWRLALIELDAGDLAAAETAILRAIAVAPESPPLIAAYARIVTQAGQFRKAEQLLASAAEIDPECDDVRNVRIWLSMARGDDAVAQRHAIEGLEVDPEAPHLHATMGAFAVDTGKTAAAARHLEQAAALDLSSVEEHGDLYREIRLRQNPLMWPMAPIIRFGPWALWGTFLVTFFVLNSVGQRRIAGLIGLGYFAYCIYTWTVPGLLRRWYDRGRRS